MLNGLDKLDGPSASLPEDSNGFDFYLSLRTESSKGFWTAPFLI